MLQAVDGQDTCLDQVVKQPALTLKGINDVQQRQATRKLHKKANFGLVLITLGATMRTIIHQTASKVEITICVALIPLLLRWGVAARKMDAGHHPISTGSLVRAEALGVATTMGHQAHSPTKITDLT